jgi:hypothetical protein
MRRLRLGLDPRRASGPAAHPPHQQAGYMTAPDQCCRIVRKFLPRRGRCRSRPGADLLGGNPGLDGERHAPDRDTTRAARCCIQPILTLNDGNCGLGWLCAPTDENIWHSKSGWSRGFATRCVGTSAGGAIPDISRSGCLLLWGYNPSYSRLTHATAIIDALKRGMKLIVLVRAVLASRPTSMQR